MIQLKKQLSREYHEYQITSNIGKQAVLFSKNITPAELAKRRSKRQNTSTRDKSLLKRSNGN